MATLTTSAFPPGSSMAFIQDYLSQQQQVNKTGTQVENQDKQLTQVQEAVNALSKSLDTTTATATTALNTANTAAQTATTALNTAQNAAGGVDNLNRNAIVNNSTSAQAVLGPFQATVFRVGGNQVVSGRNTGWTGATGTQQKGGLNADQAFPADSTYNQGQIASIGAGLIETRRQLAAVINALIGHGLIG